MFARQSRQRWGGRVKEGRSQDCEEGGRDLMGAEDAWVPCCTLHILLQVIFAAELDADTVVVPVQGLAAGHDRARVCIPQGNDDD
jgi:hypothetical protein